MKYINDLHEHMSRKLSVGETLQIVCEMAQVDEDTAKDIIRNMSLMDYMKLEEGDNPFGEFGKFGQKPEQNSSNMKIDPSKLRVGDTIQYKDQAGNVVQGTIKDEPDNIGQVRIDPEVGNVEDEMMVGDLLPPDEEDIQRELARMQQLAGIGGGSPDMGESATGGASGAGGVANAVSRINPVSRQRSPHGSAYKSARSKTSEYKRTLSKRGKKK